MRSRAWRDPEESLNGEVWYALWTQGAFKYPTAAGPFFFSLPHGRTTAERGMDSNEREPEEGRQERFLSSFFEKKSPLDGCTYGDVDPFVIEGTFDCKVIRVFDGDTFWAAIPSPLTHVEVSRVCCRLLGVDTPEMPTAHADAMTDEGKRAFAARDRLVELVTSLRLDTSVRYFDTSDTELPSLSDTDLQRKMDAENDLVLIGGLDLRHGTDKYGRYLVHIKAPDGRDVSQTLVDEGYARPYMP